MFNSDIYQQRRNQLKHHLGSGLILWLGNEETPRNYRGCTFPFRQDSSFLYYFGLNEPHLAVLIDLDHDQEYLVGDELTIQDIIWSGHQPSLQETARKSGILEVISWIDLEVKLRSAQKSQCPIHFLPPYQACLSLKLAQLLDLSPQNLSDFHSPELVKAVIGQRSVKTETEIDQIEKALEISYTMVQTALSFIQPGKTEQDILAAVEKNIADSGSYPSFSTILTIHGEVFHNSVHYNCLEKGHLLLMDSGAESPEYYASDITRTFPVSGRFSTMQLEIYQLVLQAQQHAIAMIRPQIAYRDVHLDTARVIVNGLKDLGLMKGQTEDAVQAGAHALFFPHGLGHMLGLDVHDMENLGEDHVGYNDEILRSRQFGLSYLRLAKPLQQNYILTVEPGIYFISALIDYWKSENRSSDFINYSHLEKYKGFGGIRIEDDVVVTPGGCRVLGRPIPKTAAEIESALHPA